MILPDPLQRYAAYWKFYAEQKIRKGTDYYLTLDNGAFENGGDPLSPSRLLGLASLLQVDEVVIPDKMYDAETTTSLFKDWMDVYGPMHSYRWAVVVQGTTPAEAWGHLKWLLNQTMYQTICLPKLLVGLDPDIRPEMVEAIVRERPELDIHFLGIHPKAPMDFRPVIEDVRSCDTSLAGVAALNGINLEWTLDLVKLSKRSEYYWTEPLTVEAYDLLKTNLDTMEDWLNA
jgi:hypothetical protein